jgi:Zn-dependent protease
MVAYAGSSIFSFVLGQAAIGGGGNPLIALVNYLGWINFLLAIFNLIPGFPLDGGRVLRAIIWGITGSFQRATNISTTIGQIIAWGFIGVGILQIFTGNFINGIWIAFIGWFLFSAAQSSKQEMTFQQHFRGVNVQTVMNRNPEIIKPSLPVSSLVHDIFLQGGHM